MLAGAAAHVRYAKRASHGSQSSTASPRRLRKQPQAAGRAQRRGSAGPLELQRDLPSCSGQLLAVPLTGSPPLLGRKRAGSVPVLRFTLAVSWTLKPDYVRALKVTWDRLCDVPRANCRGILGIMERVFEKFEAKDKHVKEVFYQAAFVDSMADTHGRRHSDKSIATLRDHIHFFVSLISQVIHSLEKPPTDIFEHIDKIGSFHHHLKQYGFRAQMWDTLGVCLVDAVVIQDCVRGFPEACKAWTLMVAALVDRLRSARKNYGAGGSSLRRSSLFMQHELLPRCPSPSLRALSISPRPSQRRGSLNPPASPVRQRYALTEKRPSDPLPSATVQ